MLWSSAAKGEIFVVDDDVTTRETLTSVLEGAGYRAVCFADKVALLSQIRLQLPVCVILEVRMPDREGLEILKKLNADGRPAPIFVTSFVGDIATAVESIRNGAHDFIEKPIDVADLLERIETAIGYKHSTMDVLSHITLHVPGCEPFTRREREVLTRIAMGETSKEAARTLGLSSRTVESYRAGIMRKVGVRNTAELLGRVLGRGNTT
ncbi:response regulator transcription factor [Bradyrhizobium sp. USDA 4486]